MMHPFLTLADDTEIVHSDISADGTVDVYIEKPDADDCFHHVTCILPGYQLKDNFGFSGEELSYYREVIESTAHLILEFSQSGGFDHAASF